MHLSFQQQLQIEYNRNFLIEHNCKFMDKYNPYEQRLACSYLKLKIFTAKLNYTLVSDKLADIHDLWNKHKQELEKLILRTLKRGDANKLILSANNVLQAYRKYYREHRHEYI